MLMTVGDADTPWHPRFFHAVTFEPQRSADDGSTVYPSQALWHGRALRISSRFRVIAWGTAVPSDGPWHGDVRIGIPPEHYACSHHACSSYILPLTLTCHRLEQSGDSDVVAENHHMFYKCYSAAVWDGFEDTAPGDCISAIKPKMVFRPMVFPAISFLVEADGWRTSTEAKFQQSRRSPSAHTGCMPSVAAEMHIFNSVQAFLSWYGVDCERGQVFRFFIPQETSRIRFLIGSVSLVVPSWTFR